MDGIDTTVGANLKEFRGDMSQAELARKMTERGFKWSQATVYEVEKGGRPLKLSEAVEVTTLLGVPLDNLLAYSERARLLKRERDLWTKWDEVVHRIRDDIETFERVRHELGAAGRALLRWAKANGHKGAEEHARATEKFANESLYDAIASLERSDESTAQRKLMHRQRAAAKNLLSGDDTDGLD